MNTMTLPAPNTSLGSQRNVPQSTARRRSDSRCAEKPRMETWSRWPSPEDSPTPGTLRTTSWTDNARWAWMSSPEMTSMLCGMSSRGASILVALRLSGAKSVVAAAPIATHYLVSARDGDGVSLLLVAADASGVSRRDYALIDGRPAADLTFDGTPAARMVSRPV